MSIDDEDYVGEHDYWDQWYAGSPLYPILAWEWRGGDVQKIAEHNGATYCVTLMNDTDWRWGEVDKPGFMPTVMIGDFYSWETAAADCEMQHGEKPYVN